MKRSYLALVALALLIMILTTVTGCDNAKNGGIDFTMDLAALLEYEAATRAGITKVTVTLTRTGYDTIIQDLTVSNNVATGRVDNLAVGYWNVKVVVFDGTTTLFTGERDVEIVAGLVQQVTILVDPGTDPPTTGSIAFNIGLNPFPGFKPQYQPISGIAMDSAGGKLYVLDATTKKIAVYNADTMTRERDLSVTQVPRTIQLNWDNTAILMGYPAGKIFSLDIASGVSTQIADLSMPINLLFPFGDKYLAASNGDYHTKIKVWASDTQSIVDSETVSYGPAIAWELNPGIQTAYFVALSLYRARLDYSTGNITISSRSGTPSSFVVRVIRNGTQLVTSNGGTLYTCSDENDQDLLNVGNLGSSFADLVNDDTNGRIFFVTSSSPYQLCGMSHSDMLIKTYADLPCLPDYLFQTDNSIIVIIGQGGEKFFSKVWAKAELEL